MINKRTNIEVTDKWRESCDYMLHLFTEIPKLMEGDTQDILYGLQTSHEILDIFQNFLINQDLNFKTFFLQFKQRGI